MKDREGMDAERQREHRETSRDETRREGTHQESTDQIMRRTASPCTTPRSRQRPVPHAARSLLLKLRPPLLSSPSARDQTCESRRQATTHKAGERDAASA